MTTNKDHIRTLLKEVLDQSKGSEGYPTGVRNGTRQEFGEYHFILDTFVHYNGLLDTRRYWEKGVTKVNTLTNCT